MAPGDLVDDAALFDFIGEFAARPLADGAIRSSGRLTGQGRDLADLLVGDAHRFPRSGRIRQPIRDGQVRQRGGLEGEPALAPAADHRHTDRQLVGNLAVIGAIGRREHDTCPERQLLRGGMAAGERFQFLALHIRKINGGWFGTTHRGSSPRCEDNGDHAWRIILYRFLGQAVLRTPLAVISSAGENLADGIIHDLAQARRYGALIHSESGRLATMVEQALEFAGIQSGRKRYDFRHVEVRDLVESALAGYQPQLREADFVVEQELEPDLPPVLGDAAALRRAIQNLLSNAIKYSGERRWIELRAGSVVKDRGVEVQITLRDSGLGIAPRDVPHIFEPFYRGRDAVAAQIHGTGLGLSLVRHIIEAHHGRVSVESVSGQGTTFRLHLPAAVRPDEVRREPGETTYEQAYIAGRG